MLAESEAPVGASVVAKRSLIFKNLTIRHMLVATARDRTLKPARRRQSVLARELAQAGIHTQVLSRLVAGGELERVDFDADLTRVFIPR